MKFWLFFLTAFFGLLVTPAHAATYATLSSCGSDVSISGGLNMIYNTIDVWRSCVGNVGKSSGKWYWEVKIIKLDSNKHGQGFIAGSGFSLNGGCEGASDCFGLYTGSSNSYPIVDGTMGSATGYSWTDNDIMGIALDLDSGNLDIYKNGTLVHTITGISGTYYPDFSIYSNENDPPYEVDFNFGQNSFSYSVPTGYNAGLCSESSCGGGQSSSTPNLLNFDLHSKNGTLSAFFSEYQNLIISCGALLLLVAVNFVIYSLVMAMVSFRKKML